MKRLVLLATTAVFIASAAAALTPQEIANSLWADGYTGIEITQGRSQIKVEAVRGSERLEVVYDAATGAELKREVGTASGDDVSDGVFLRQRNRDFVRLASASDDGVEDHDRGHGNDDDHDDSDNPGQGSGGHGADDGPDHDAGDDHGGSHGSGSRGSDDHGSDDHGGSKRGGGSDD